MLWRPSEADLSRILHEHQAGTWADLRRADLRGWDLSGVQLRFAKLEGADLSGANLFMADLNGADCRGASFRGADLALTTLCGIDGSGADFRQADLSGAHLSHATLTGADFRGAVVDETTMLENVRLTAIAPAQLPASSRWQTLWAAQARAERRSAEATSRPPQRPVTIRGRSGPHATM